jgi:hypothetical protein
MAIAVANYRDEKSFAVASKFNVQDSAGMVWAFA